MPTLVLHQKLPTTKIEREELRDKGQFWTPDWIAEAMTAYVLLNNSIKHVFDPGVGAGAFLRAAKKLGEESGRKLQLLGAEIDPMVLREAQASGLSQNDLKHVEIRDFLLNPPQKLFDAIVANPPYIRHHRLSQETKEKLKQFATELMGCHLDGRAGYHIYFLLRALQLLKRGGRLSFIVPADTFEGVFSKTLWNWISKNYRVEAVTTFTSGATPFPQIDTNAVILMIKNESPSSKIFWAQCRKQCSQDLHKWIASNFDAGHYKDMAIFSRSLSEALETGLSRPPQTGEKSRYTLADFAKTMRGIATGANEYFILTQNQATELRLSKEFLVPVVARSRDAKGVTIDDKLLQEMERGGKPTQLLSLDGRSKNKFPVAIQRYLSAGEAQGLDKRALIKTRRPWYKMEVREKPPFLFAYLGRKNARFIINEAGIIPTTGFLCVYPHRRDKQFLSKLWRVLSSPETINNLKLVGKSYGDGAIKVEPRALERLPLPERLVQKEGLMKACHI